MNKVFLSLLVVLFCISCNNKQENKNQETEEQAMLDPLTSVSKQLNRKYYRVVRIGDIMFMESMKGHNFEEKTLELEGEVDDNGNPLHCTTVYMQGFPWNCSGCEQCYTDYQTKGLLTLEKGSFDGEYIVTLTPKADQYKLENILKKTNPTQKKIEAMNKKEKICMLMYHDSIIGLYDRVDVDAKTIQCTLRKQRFYTPFEFAQDMGEDASQYAHVVLKLDDKKGWQVEETPEWKWDEYVY